MSKNETLSAIFNADYKTACILINTCQQNNNKNMQTNNISNYSFIPINSSNNSRNNSPISSPTISSKSSNISYGPSIGLFS